MNGQITLIEWAKGRLEDKLTSEEYLTLILLEQALKSINRQLKKESSPRETMPVICRIEHYIARSILFLEAIQRDGKRGGYEDAL